MRCIPRRGRHPGRRSVVFLALVFAVVLVAACGEPSAEAPASEEAVELWSHPDSVGIAVYAPLDLDLASRDVAWGLDRVARAVLHYEPGRREYSAFGLMDNPPAEVVEPARLAVSADHGVFVYDDSTGLVDHFTSGGQHIRGFAPGLRPAIFEVSRRPLGLTMGATEAGADGVPHLLVVRTDFRGLHPDTLLGPGYGPETMRAVAAVPGSLTVTPSETGLWLYARQVPDTVFEVSAKGSGRKLVLPEPDARRLGVTADVQQEIVWLVAPRPAGGVDFEAYDVSGVAPGGVIDGTPAYLGARTTPPGFAPQTAYDGVVAGWFRSPRGRFVPRAFDMRVDELRSVAESARADRAARRAAIDADWARLEEEATRQSEQAQAESAVSDSGGVAE